MSDFRADFKDKKITMLGLGLLGRGVGDAAFLAECGASLTITDRKTESELADSVEQLKQYPNIAFHLGGHREEDFTRADMVIKAAGVRLDSSEIATAKKAGVPVMMSTALFAKYAKEMGAKVIGVTGTRGKSTISHMIFHALKHAGARAHLGGNVRGISTLAMLPDIRKGDLVVLELDSWQLQGFGELHMSPHVAIFSNLMPDHQNYYRNMEEYFSDKANIFTYQKKGDVLVIGESVEKMVRAAHPPVEPLLPGKLAQGWQLKIPGVHNNANASLAASALLSLGFTVDKIQSGIESFEGVEGRLQLLSEWNAVSVYNDNNATTPEATIAALRALDTGKKNIVLIAGGSDKGLDMSELASEIQRTCSSVVLLAGTGTDVLKKELTDANVFQTLSDAVDAAYAMVKQGDILLFSPAFASFGMFKNEYERNDEFVARIRERDLRK